MDNKMIIISRIKYNPGFYELTDQQKEKFHQDVARVMGKYGLVLLDRYELITKPREIINIFESGSMDYIREIKVDLDSIHYHKYIDGSWEIGIKV